MADSIDAALALMTKWMADDSGYEEEAWPILVAAMEANRMSDRNRFSEEPKRRPANECQFGP